MIKNNGKNKGTLILLLTAGIVLGGFIGEYLSGVPALNWLGYGRDFGLATPISLDLGVLALQFGFTVKCTIAGIMGMALAAVIYKKM